MLTTTTTRRRSQRLEANVRKNVDDGDVLVEETCGDFDTATVAKPSSRKRSKIAEATRKSTRIPATTTTSEKLGDDARPNEQQSFSEEDRVLTAASSTVAAPRRNHPTLPSTLETAARGASATTPSTIQHVIGIDEAGRGPLAGPVVVAAVCLDAGAPSILGITDSKRITSELDREALYTQIVGSISCQWAVAVIDAAKIDEINILQATLLGMRLVAETIMMQQTATRNNVDSIVLENYPIHAEASISHLGCYVVHSGYSRPSTVSAKDTAKKDTVESTEQSDEIGSTGDTASCGQSTAAPPARHSSDSSNGPIDPNTFYALIDGNRIPENMPCPAEAIVKGDSHEYCIATASILAKVTRDRLMHAYDALYPLYGLAQHKGYATVAHRRAILEHGGAPIHRRSFAPLKNMAATKVDAP